VKKGGGKGGEGQRMGEREGLRHGCWGMEAPCYGHKQKEQFTNHREPELSLADVVVESARDWTWFLRIVRLPYVLLLL